LDLHQKINAVPIDKLFFVIILGESGTFFYARERIVSRKLQGNTNCLIKLTYSHSQKYCSNNLPLSCN